MNGRNKAIDKRESTAEGLFRLSGATVLASIDWLSGSGLDKLSHGTACVMID